MKKVLKICICGGGNLAHALSAVIGANDSVNLNVLTRQPHLWKEKITAFYKTSLVIEGKLNKVSDDPESVISESDIVIFALPTFAHQEILEKIRNYLSHKTWIGAIPGWGGFDWQARRILGKKARIFGIHRVSHICRTIEYGSTVDISGVSPELFVAGFPVTELPDLADKLQNLMNIPFVLMDNFLPITLTPSNSLCHPVRLYSLLRNRQPYQYFEHLPLFYGEWDDLASELFIKCSDELQQICKKIPLDLSYVPHIFAHYGVKNLPELTQRIRTIEALGKIRLPVLEISKGAYTVDLQSRYFTEDIPYGLLTIAAVGRLVKVETPTIDSIIKWAQRLLNKIYLDEQNLLGADAAHLPLPQNFGIENLPKLIRKAVR